jgi:hypothetical protein
MVNISLDGKAKGKIENGDSEHCPVDPGRHAMYVQVPLWKSKELQFDIASGATKELECGIPGFNYLRNLALTVIGVVLIIALVQNPDPPLGPVLTALTLVFSIVSLFVTQRRNQYIYLKEAR